MSDHRQGGTPIPEGIAEVLMAILSSGYVVRFGVPLAVWSDDGWVEPEWVREDGKLKVRVPETRPDVIVETQQ